MGFVRNLVTASLCAMILIMGLSSIASAQSVQKVKGNSVLIDSGSIQMKPGEEYYTVTETGKKTGLLQISQVKGNKAVGKLTKGAAAEGQTLSVKSAKAKPKPKNEDNPDQDANDTDEYHPPPKVKNSFGILLGYSMDSISLPAANSSNVTVETASLSGSSIKFRGFYDHPMSDDYNFRVTAGYDGFNGTYSAKSTTINSDAGATSKLAVTFISADAEIDWNLYKKSLTSFYLTIGYSFDYVASLSTNLYSLQLSSSYLNSAFVGTGANIKMGQTSYLPIYLHYNYFLAGTGVSQSAINIGLGWGWGF